MVRQPSLAKRLLEAVKKDDSSMVRVLIRANVGVDEDLGGGVTPLLTAVIAKNEGMVSLLLEHGADPNRISGKGKSPVHEAAGTGQEQVLRQLLNNGGGVRLQAGANDFTPLHEAARKDKLKAAKLLLLAGADVNAPSRSGLTPLHVAAVHGKTRAVRLLLDNGADVHARSSGGKTPLHAAAECCSSLPAEVVELLLAAGADPNVRTAAEETPLHLVSNCYDGRNGDVLVRVLAARGADLNALNGSGWPPLARAITASGRAAWSTLLALLDCGADPNATVELENTCDNIYYVGTEFEDLCKDPNAPTDLVPGTSMLHLAVRHLNCNALQPLLDNGARATARDSRQRMAADLARELYPGDWRFVEFLKKCETLFTGPSTKA